MRESSATVSPGGGGGFYVKGMGCSSSLLGMYNTDCGIPWGVQTGKPIFESSRYCLRLHAKKLRCCHIDLVV